MSDKILNQSSKNNYLIDIPDNDYINDFRLSVKSVLLPSISIPEVKVPLNPMLMGTVAGSATEFGPITVTVVMDEEYNALCGVYNWMLNVNDYIDSRSIDWLEDKEQSLAIHILGNDRSSDNIKLTFRFYGVFPNNIDSVEVGYDSDVDEVVLATMTFSYKYFEIEKDGKIITPIKRKRI